MCEMSDFGLDFWRILCQNKTMKTKKGFKMKELLKDVIKSDWIWYATPIVWGLVIVLQFVRIVLN